MDDLQTIKVGGLTKDSDTSSPTQITSYINSIVNVGNVALGCKEDGTSYPDIKSKAKEYSVAIGRNSQAERYAVSIGEKAYSFNCAFALGADAYASSQGATAIGRYAKATASGAMQLNGNCTEEGEYIAVNNEANTLKFYAGGDNNVTIVDATGKIPLATSATKLQTSRKIGGTAFDGTADINLSATSATTAGTCTGNSATATKLQTARTIGGVSFDGTANISLPGVNTAGTQNTSGKASTAGTADNANALNNGATITIGSTTYTLSVVEIEGTGKVLALTPKA